jgi:hypothetical protein
MRSGLTPRYFSVNSFSSRTIALRKAYLLTGFHAFGSKAAERGVCMRDRWMAPLPIDRDAIHGVPGLALPDDLLDRSGAASRRKSRDQRFPLTSRRMIYHLLVSWRVSSPCK